MINMYASDGRIKPFDKNADGFVMGEGATALILEDYEHARNREAHIYAEYIGGGFRLEGWGVTTPMIGGSFYQEAIQEALNRSGLNSADIDLICAHGVGNAASDYYEAKAISDVFTTQKPYVTALKPFVGHNLGGSTLIELAVLLLSLENKIIPPILNTRDLTTKFKLNFVTEQKEGNVHFFMKTCCAFAGYNAAAIFRNMVNEN